MRRKISILLAATAAAATAVVGGGVTPSASAATWTPRPIGSPGVTAAVIGQELAGEGVTVVSTSFTGDNAQAGLFTDAADAIDIADGVVLSSGDIADIVGPNDSGSKTTSFGGAGDPDLDVLVDPNSTNDAAVFEMTFVPVSADLEINYVFASDEYKEFVDTSFNDVFAFYVNGQNCATVAAAVGPPQPVTINTINHLRNSQIFVDNADASRSSQFDGFTQVLTCFSTVTPGVNNTLKLAIADTSDYAYDSAVFIETSGVTSTPKTKYTPVAPARALDTRPTGLKVGAGQIYTLPLAGMYGIPSDALSVALNVTSTESDANGFLTVFPNGESLPVASNVNYTAGSSVPNLVVAKLGAGGAINIFAEQPTHVIVDVFGYFSTSGTTGFQAGAPFRAIDTRTTGKIAKDGVVTFPVAGVNGVPPGVPAVALNLTLDQPDEAGFASVFASGSPLPQTSNVNVGFGETRPNVVFAPVGPDGQVSVYVSMGTHVIADVFGWYTPASDAELFKAVKPKRVIDTRQSQPVPAGGELLLKVTDIVGVPSTATAVVLNVTVTGPTETGFLTIHAADIPRPQTSNLNYTADKTVPNVVVTGVSPDGRIKVYAEGQTHVIVDVAGWYG